MTAALDGLLIEGLKNNIPLLKVIIQHDDFVKGDYSTSFIEEKNPQSKIDKTFDHKKFYKVLAGVEARRMGM